MFRDRTACGAPPRYIRASEKVTTRFWLAGMVKKKATPKQLPDISSSQASKLLGISSERIRQLEKDGYFSKSKPGWWPVEDLVSGYIRFLKEEERRSTKSASASRLTDARAEMVAVQVARETGTLKAEAKAVALSVVDELLGGLKADLLSIPARVTRDVQVGAKIEAEVERVLREAALRTGRAASGEEEGGEDPAAGGEDPA